MPQGNIKINDQSAVSESSSLANDLEVLLYKAPKINNIKARKMAVIAMGIMLVNIAAPNVAVEKPHSGLAPHVRG